MAGRTWGLQGLVGGGEGGWGGSLGEGPAVGGGLRAVVTTEPEPALGTPSWHTICRLLSCWGWARAFSPFPKGGRPPASAPSPAESPAPPCLSLRVPVWEGAVPPPASPDTPTTSSHWVLQWILEAVLTDGWGPQNIPELDAGTGEEEPPARSKSQPSRPHLCCSPLGAICGVWAAPRLGAGVCRSLPLV